MDSSALVLLLPEIQFVAGEGFSLQCQHSDCLTEAKADTCTFSVDGRVTAEGERHVGIIRVTEVADSASFCAELTHLDVESEEEADLELELPSDVQPPTPARPLVVGCPGDGADPPESLDLRLSFAADAPDGASGVLMAEGAAAQIPEGGLQLAIRLSR